MLGKSQSHENRFRKLSMEYTFNFNLHHTDLFGQYWKPETVKAVVVLVHGMGEHSSRYTESVVPHLLRHHFAVVGFDLFGHGKSKGKRGHCPSYEALLEAIEYVIKKSKDLFPDKDTFLYGHSLGGNLAVNYVLRKENTLKGVVASSPFLKLAFQPPNWKLVLGKILLGMMPSITLSSEIDEGAISRDPIEVKRYHDDELVHNKISPMFSFPVMAAGEWAIENAEQLKMPVLVLHGTGDRLIDYNGSVEFCKKATSAQLKLYNNGFHELHHDLCKEEFIQDILNWLEN